MKKIERVSKELVYELDKKELSAISTMYDLLEDIRDHMDIDDVININGNSEECSYTEISFVFAVMERLLGANNLTLTKECEEETEL